MKLFNFKKILNGKVLRIFFVLLLILIPLTTQVALAYEPQDTSYYGRRGSFLDAIQAPEMNLESFVNETLWAILFSLMRMIGTVTGLGTSTSSRPDPGAIAGVLGLIVGLYKTPPVSGISYLAHLRETIGLSPAYAQGLGFQTLSPIIPIWTAFRNITYGFFALILVVIGFMIMFRIKISPQAVVTIQSALPRVIMALILVTFSYAIAGFIMDLTYVILFAVVGLLRTTSPPLLRAVGIPGIAGGDWTRWALTNLNAIGFGAMVMLTSAESMMTLIERMVLGALMLPPELESYLPAGNPLEGLSGLLVLILLVVLLVVLIKISWVILKNYISIVLSVIAAPFQIMLGAFPGVKGFQQWLANIIASASVFPVVAILFLLAAILIGPPSDINLLIVTFETDPFGRSNLTYPSGVAGPPMVGGGATTPANLQAILGIGVIFFIPSICKQLQALLRRPLGLESAISWAGVKGSFVGGALYREGQDRIASLSREAPGSAFTSAKGAVQRLVRGRVARQVPPTEVPVTQVQAAGPSYHAPKGTSRQPSRPSVRGRTPSRIRGGGQA